MTRQPHRVPEHWGLQSLAECNRHFRAPTRSAAFRSGQALTAEFESGAVRTLPISVFLSQFQLITTDCSAVGAILTFLKLKNLLRQIATDFRAVTLLKIRPLEGRAGYT